MSEEKQKYGHEFTAEYSNVVKEAKRIYDSLSFIHSSLDDAELTPEEFRIYCHLLRRAGGKGEAWPSYQSMGNHCFGKDNTLEPSTCRRKAIKAINSLEERGMLTKEYRKNDGGGNSSNVYIINDPGAWSAPPLVRGAHPPSAWSAPKGTPIEGTPIEGGDPLLRKPKQRKEYSDASVYMEKAKSIGLSPPEFVKLTNAVLDECRLTLLVDNSDSPDAVWLHNDAKDAAIFLAQVGYGHADEIRELSNKWKDANKWRADPVPKPQDLKLFVSKRESDAENVKPVIQIRPIGGDIR